MTRPNEQLLVAQVTDIGEFGATLRSEDYEGELFLHISEIRLKKEQKIADALRKNQVLVVRILREDKATNRAFVSLKGIDPSEAKRVLRDWKEERRAAAILKEVLTKTGQPEDLLLKIKDKASERFGSLSEAFRAILEDRDKVSQKLALPPEVAASLEERIGKELLKKVYAEKKRIKIFFLDPDGVEKLKEIGRKFSGVQKDDLKVIIKVVAPPEYELIVESVRPKKARTAVEKILKDLKEETGKLGGRFSA